MGRHSTGVPGSRRLLDEMLAALSRVFPSERQARPKSEQVVSRPSPPRVLVADDNPDHLSVAQELLARWGIAPLLAADGAEAVALAFANDFDMILMDLQMPILDGLGATKQIRHFEAEHSRPRVPVIAYTSSAFGANHPLLRASGLDDAVEKPCNADALLACLLRWCPAWVAAETRMH